MYTLTYHLEANLKPPLAREPLLGNPEFGLIAQLQLIQVIYEHGHGGTLSTKFCLERRKMISVGAPTGIERGGVPLAVVAR